MTEQIWPLLDVLQMLVEGVPATDIRALTRASACNVLRIEQAILMGRQAKKNAPTASLSSRRDFHDIAFLYGYLHPNTVP